MDLNGYIITGILVAAVAFAVFAGFKAIRNTRDIEGTVVDKKFVPAHTKSNTKTRSVSMHGDRNQRIPQTSIETRTIPDAWSVIVKPNDGSSKVTRKVDEGRWNDIEIGDDWKD